MADVELLPLPELPRQVEGYNSDYWEAGQIEEYAADYARACVEANLAALQAENERLREEVETWKTYARGKHDLWQESVRRAERLAEALREARDAIEDWAGYASDYFREKHDLAGDLAKVDALLRD